METCSRRKSTISVAIAATIQKQGFGQEVHPKGKPRGKHINLWITDNFELTFHAATLGSEKSVQSLPRPLDKWSL